jgi:catalase (peroxidase I)
MVLPIQVGPEPSGAGIEEQGLGWKTVFVPEKEKIFLVD